MNGDLSGYKQSGVKVDSVENDIVIALACDCFGYVVQSYYAW